MNRPWLPRARHARVPLAPAALALLAWLLTGALAASAEAAVTASHSPAQPPSQGQTATIIIDSISPGIAVPGRPVRLSGRVRNNLRTALQGLNVQLWSSGSQFTERGQFDSFESGSYQLDGRVPGAMVRLPATIGAGTTVGWRASFRPGRVGIRSFGVYPLAAAVWDANSQLAVERTFLPYWPGRDALRRPLKIAWLWPLIDRPHRGICAAMLDNSLAANLGGGGRLGGLLAAGDRYATAAKLTWVVDPALLDDAQTMTHPYRVLDGSRCWQSTRRPANAAARNWLATLATVTRTHPVFATPYADPDVAALTHRGLDADLQTAMRDGSSVASQFLRRPNVTTAWPPNGLADAGVLDNTLAAGGSVKSGSVQGGIKTLVLDSAMMPSANPALFYTPDAVTHVRTGLGRTVRVLLADHRISGVLGAVSAAARSAPGTTTAASQRFLAETAMIAAEAPNLPRSIVVAPPRRWNPGAALASELLGDTVSAPWLRPSYAGKLAPANTPPWVPAPELEPLPANKVTGELGRGYLKSVRNVEARARLLESILTNPTASYRKAIARLESSAWRGSSQAKGKDLIRQAGAYLDSQERMVAIIPSSQVTLGGNRGTVPVSIENKLSHAVQVRLQATVSATRAVPAASRLTITSAPGKVIAVGPGMKETVRLQVRAHSSGLSEIQLRLLNPAGKPLTGSDRTLKVRSTAFGTLALVIIAVALGVLVLTLVARVIRRGIREGRPGTVVAEGNPTDDDGPSEARDELADARGGAQPETRL